MWLLPLVRLRLLLRTRRLVLGVPLGRPLGGGALEVPPCRGKHLHPLVGHPLVAAPVTAVAALRPLPPPLQEQPIGDAAVLRVPLFRVVLFVALLLPFLVLAGVLPVCGPSSVQVPPN